MKIKSISTSLLPTLVATILFGGLLTPAFGESYKKWYYLNAEIGRWGVGAPAGHFLLIRKENTTCAIRFTDFNMFNSGGGNVSVSKSEAEYDYFHQPDGSNDYKKSNVETSHFKLKSTSIVSGTTNASTGWVPPTLAESSTNTIKCGTLALHWFGLVGVSFFEGAATTPDEGIELAPTKWRDVSEINISDPRITWYRYGEARKLAAIPIEDLW
jgi:hypothetical protein